MDSFKEVDKLMQYIADDLLKDHKEKDIIVEEIKKYAEAYNKIKLILPVVVRQSEQLVCTFCDGTGGKVIYDTYLKCKECDGGGAN